MAGQYCQLLGSAPTSFGNLLYAMQFQGDHDPYNGGVTINIFSFSLGPGDSLPSVTFDFADGRRCACGVGPQSRSPSQAGSRCPAAVQHLRESSQLEAA